MATLLPSLSSDDEAPPLPLPRGDEEDDSDDDDDREEAAIDGSFQFGGILGEDGGAGGWQSTRIGGASGNNKNKAAWSYRQILQKLEDQTQETEASKSNPRMDVASLIEAKRRSILPKEGSNKKEEAGAGGRGNRDDRNGDREGDDPGGSRSDHGESGSDGSGAGSDGDGGGGSEDSDSDSYSDDGEGALAAPDPSSLAAMEDDVVKTRAGAGQGEDHRTREPEEGPKETGAEDSEDDGGERGRDGGAFGGEDDDRREAEKAAAFFDSSLPSPGSAAGTRAEAFSQLALSRPLLRAVAAMGFVQPTPVQAAVVPLALSGRDVCASAVTGSGKTAAFLLPLLERLLHRSSSARASIKAVVLAPTRELAAQGVAFGAALSRFTKIRVCLVTGGSKNAAAQHAELRARPEIVVATPGRLLDHVLNSPGVTLESVEFLVLDEADRLLDLGFQDEVHELLRHCPAERRQTLLFSATMNTKVDDLARLSLKRPVRVRIAAADAGPGGGGGEPRPAAAKDVEVAPRLEQEFVRVRSGNEGVNREGMLLALLSRTFRTHAIVFFDTKAEAHRMMILCGLCGIRCAELHGNLTQPQRLHALDEFRAGRVDVLLASDLACRGLDIDSVRAVVNFEMPSNLDTYIHRIGRTARAGRGGQSCTLIGEGRRHLMKEIIRHAEAARKKGSGAAEEPSAAKAGVVRSRTIPPAVVAHFVDRIRELEPHVEDVLQAEAVAKMDRLAEMEATKAQNIIEHSDEIQSRPRREWFASKGDKERTKQTAAERQRQIEEKAGTGTHRMTRKKRRAREALAALSSAPPPRDDEDEDDDGEADDADREDGARKRQKQQQVNVKADARKKKRVDAARALEASEKSVRDLDEEREARAAAARRRRKSPPSSSSGHAAGDGSLFDEDRMAHSSGRAKKKKEEGSASASAPAKSSYEFRGYDPNRRLGKKRGNKAFKSKSKYRRR